MTPSPALEPAEGAARAHGAGRLSVWIDACRPKTLAASVVPVLVGTAVAKAEGQVFATRALVALGCAIAIQVGTNLVNDAYDFEKGADTPDRLGPTRAVQAGLLTASAVKRAALLAFVAATALGGYLVWVGGPVILAIGVASILSGVAYTAGPLPLAYLGLGDLFVLAFFGFVAVAGTTLLHLGRVPEAALWAGAAVGALATAILVVNNLRDRASDLAANKRTLVARFGRRFGEVELSVLIVLAYAAPTILVARGLGGLPALLPWVTFPLAIRLVARVLRSDGPALNPLLGDTAKLLGLLGGALALGLVL